MNIYRKIINTKPKYPDGFDSKLKSLVKHLLRRELSKRYGNLKNGAEDIKQHRFFDNIDFNDLLNGKYKPPYVPPTSELKQTESNWEKEKVNGTKAIPAKDDPFHDW